MRGFAPPIAPPLPPFPASFRVFRSRILPHQHPPNPHSSPPILSHLRFLCCPMFTCPRSHESPSQSTPPSPEPRAPHLPSRLFLKALVIGHSCFVIPRSPGPLFAHEQMFHSRLPIRHPMLTNCHTRSQSPSHHPTLTTSSLSTPQLLTNHSLTTQCERFASRPISPTTMPTTTYNFDLSHRPAKVSP